MGGFYFHLRAGDHVIPDEQGQDLPDVIRSPARSHPARELLAGAIRARQTSVPDAFVIADEAGRELDTVPLATVLPEPFRK
ncbi:hypothetical protein [Bradyrhizobium sp. AUGA SZCCT0431]|uniref:hypothetical protein n=1 Tax=Bradyrhizobium sp. AUGA SZCCT0431 TaxID=2807674 RepID=UPI001BA4C8C3|nr:hypothetical protein [Bradyrhizobium sp. AUGA SZCCT0431]MBR1148866.1 hypothetical protein [Bradyrhizobium sp. AUGA SZCCT0431]